MKACPCIRKKQTCSKRSALGWIVPAVVLALVPKCPLCVVAYAAMLGVGLSVTTATLVREAIVLTCVVACVLVIVRRIRPR